MLIKQDHSENSEASNITIGMEEIKKAESNCKVLFRPNSLQISEIVTILMIQHTHCTRLANKSVPDKICVWSIINSLNGEKRFCLKLFVSKKCIPLPCIQY